MNNKEQNGNYLSFSKRNPVADCPLTAAFATMGGKWKLIIIYWLNVSPLHFAGIQQKVSGISNKVLGQQLKELVSDKIINRQVTGKIPSPVIYSLTEYGKTLIPIVENIRVWGRSHIENNR